MSFYVVLRQTTWRGTLVFIVWDWAIWFWPTWSRFCFWWPTIAQRPLWSWNSPRVLGYSGRWDAWRSFGDSTWRSIPPTWVVGEGCCSKALTWWAMVRKCTKKLKEKVAQRVEAMNRKRVAAGKPKKVFWVRTPDKKFHGGKDLASTAIYPKRFARAVFKCWLKA